LPDRRDRRIGVRPLDTSNANAAVILAAVRGEGAEQSLGDALRSGWRELAHYLAAGAVYIAIGVTFVEFLFSWVVAAGFLLLSVLALPALVRRLRA
jgi:hypothetical protein